MSISINVGPLGGNPEASIRLVYGSNVSDSRVIGFVRKTAEVKTQFGLITEQEAKEIIAAVESQLASKA